MFHRYGFWSDVLVSRLVDGCSAVRRFCAVVRLRKITQHVLDV
jgi:hypothetical protein